MTKHKDKVSWIVLALIAALTLASIINIIAKSKSYHAGFSANLIGIGFGVSLAVTVYIVMIANTAKTRWTAATFAAVFAVVSATIQTALYLDESAPLAVAIAYGAGVPGFEAALAILEALLRREVVEEEASSQLAATRHQLAQLQSENAKLANQLPLKVATPVAKEAPLPKSPVSSLQSPPSLSAKTIAKMQEVASLAESQPFATDAELANLLQWTDTTARRYRTLAEENSLIHRNGDGRYHPTIN